MQSRRQAIHVLCSAVRSLQAPSAVLGQTAAGSISPGCDAVHAGLAYSIFRTFAQPAYQEELEFKPYRPAVPPLQPRDFLPSSRRSGVIAVKAGMTHDWDQWNIRIPLTVLWIDDCQVVQVKTEEHEGYNALQLGCGSKRDKQVHFGQLGHCRAAGVPLKRKYAEFPVTPDAMLPVGTALNAAHFAAGQHVDVQGITLGKGFQGVVKRFGFAGQPASHGTSLSHRSLGSIGAGQDPGKVFKGKKMPGRMGGKKRTVPCVWVYKVDPARNLLYVRGQVPGHRGNFVTVRDAVLTSFAEQPARPFPTHIGPLPTDVSVASAQASDPYLL